jgi:hypothetical protein
MGRRTGASRHVIRHSLAGHTQITAYCPRRAARTRRSFSGQRVASQWCCKFGVRPLSGQINGAGWRARSARSH